MRCIPRRDAARAHRLVPAGRGGGEHEGSGRQRALLAGSSLMTRPLALVIRDEPALAAQALVHDKVQAPSSAPPRPAPETALLWCRHGALRAPGVQNGGDQPGHHAARHRSPLKTRRKHQAIARFLGDAQATEALIPSVLDTLSPTSPSTDPHRHAGPTDTTAPRGRHLETHA